ncbi:nucleotide sugar dehydrogenase, partial [bacterium]|nr:nucleotide sugar dehydrogenase [bacterium]
MKIAVVGTGYVGLVTGTCFADLGNEVVCVDIDEAKIEGLNQGKLPIYEPGLEDVVVRNHKAGRLSFSTDLPSAVKASEVIFLAVGTPPLDNGEADLRAVREVSRVIGQNLNAPGKVIVNKSTVPVGTGVMTTEIIEKESDGKHPFAVVSNPEFLREGQALNDTMHPDRVVIGS